MDINFFDLEIKRLSNQWPNAYSAERTKIFFNAFRDVSNFDFRDAVTHCLATCKGAPLLKELTEAIHVARNNYFQQKRITEAEQRNAFLSIADDGRTCDPEFKNKCVDLYKSYMDKKITKEQFEQGCDLLDQAAKLYRKSPPPKPTKPTHKPYNDDDDAHF